MKWRSISPPPAAEHYREALGQAFVKDDHRLMLAAHLAAPDQILSPAALAAAVGGWDHRYTNLRYGKLGRSIATFLGIEPAKYDDGRRCLWTTAFAAGWREPANGAWYWQLYPQVVSALLSKRPEHVA